MTDYDDPKVEEAWCDEQREVVRRYLAGQKGLVHGEVGEWPAWHAAPYFAIWAVESHVNPGRIGWWAVSGDVPTDYISASEVEPPQHPRKAMKVVAQKWGALAEDMAEGRQGEDYWIGSPEKAKELAPLLKARSLMLAEIVEDDELWEED